MTIYPPLHHPKRKTDPHTERLAELPTKRSLLGDLSRFCRAFYHANQWEAEVFLCLQCSPAADGRTLKPHDPTDGAPACGNHQLRYTYTDDLGSRTADRTHAVAVGCFSLFGS